MKELKTYILESSKRVFSKEELRNDYENASGAIGQEKKDLIAKYEVTTKKVKDIQHAILLKLQELRKDEKEFDVKDINDFNRLTDNDTQYFNELKNENDDFVKYLLEYWEERIKKNGKDLIKWVNITSFAGLSFSANEKSLIKSYQKVREELASRDPKNIAAKEKEAYSIDVLNTKLTAELEDFKKEYLKRVEASAEYTYKNLPKEIEKMEDTLKEMKADYEEKKSEIKGYMARWKAEEPIHKYENKLIQKKSILRKYKTKNEFIKVCVEDAEKTFRGNVDALTHRVYDKKFDVENIKVSNVKDDPKIFKLMIEDGTKKLYCRSILAAEFSDKMVPHFRFIMTDKK